MPKVDFEWVKQQLTRAKVRKITGKTAIELLKAWEELDFPSEELEHAAIDTFAALAKGHALVEDTADHWLPAQAGFMLQVGDTVRVRSDAFSGEAGRIHNGRVGRVVAKRSGDIIVKHTDGIEPSRDDARYPASSLEKRV